MFYEVLNTPVRMDANSNYINAYQTQGVSQNLKGAGVQTIKRGTIYTYQHISFYFYFYIFNILQTFAFLFSTAANLRVVQIY